MSPDLLVSKARVLHEALPYFRRFARRTFVIKYGGNAMLSDELKASFVKDIVLLHTIGVRPVIVHGGGPQISELMSRLDQEPRFVGGYRVTGADELDVVQMVLQKSNKDLVALVNAHGALAVGVSGEDGNLLQATKLRPDGQDIGFVGEVSKVDPRVLDGLLSSGFIPVVAPIAIGEDGQAYNVNADHVAGAIAAAVNADKVVFLTDVEGLYEDLGDAGSLISNIGPDDLRRMLPKLSTGMIPKVTACLRAIDAGVTSAHILDGRVEHAVLLEIFTDEGVGTMVSAT
jgi:acetylglutamate kinase